ncbi:MAG: hypothetical protein HN742_31450 [Lentisphaerae bacterium]|nr:hypothetical protein [Lentisphaerota bacterium]MBT5612963.1 hypothetical protein [Lentisphaerota bacterium]MBT7059041.1 hypothetical protein [Lentisphaerota bacterium]MBT7846428.1 hypothetical protein [Lentisphaerota bacterium]
MRILLLTVLLGTSVSAADLAAGWTHSVALQGGRVWTWGDNAYGQLGQPDAGRSLHPRPVAGLRGVVEVAASWHTLAVTAEGYVYAWGRNTYGQLGNGQFGVDAREMSPARVTGLSEIIAISAGWDHSLALTRTGTIYAWGSRSHGQLGDGIRETGRPSPVPVLVPGLTDITAIAAGGQHSLALRADGTLYAWGSNWDGQLGNGKLGKDSHSAVPQPVSGPRGEGLLTGVTSIGAGALHSVAVTGKGHVYGWGYNGTGQVPNGNRGGFWGSSGKRNVPSPVAALVGGSEELVGNALAVAAGRESTYVLTTQGGVLSAGWSMYGELGSGSYGSGNRDKLYPVRTGKSVVWDSPSAGRWAPSLVYRYTDRGHADDGITDLEVVDAFRGPALVVAAQGGAGLRSGRISRRENYVEAQASLEYPAQATVGQPVSSVFSRLMFGVHDGDDDFAAAVRLRWVNVESGETVDLPLGTGARAAGAVLPPLGDVIALASGVRHALVRDKAGEIWAWGHNGYGQIGDGTVRDRCVATRLPPFDESSRPLPPKPAPPPIPVTKPPEGKVTSVREHGATGDGIALDQVVLQKIIDACSAKGGGTVWFPPGNYRTGTLQLRDGVRLHLSPGATILASTNRDHYLSSAVIKAADVHDIGLTGAGVIDGQGHFTGARGWRHNCVNMENCRDVLVEGISTVNAGSWTQHYIRCTGLTIRNATVRSLRPGRNNDGIDLSGCEEVRIEGCTVISDDDAIVIKSQRAERVNRNIQVIGNTCHTYRGAFKLGTETRSAYQNLLCRDLVCYGSKALELYSVDGSKTDGILVENVRGYDALVALNIRLGARLRPYYWAKGLAPKVGYLRNIRIRNIEVEIGHRSWREILLEHRIQDAELATGRPEAPYDSCISGLPGHPVEDVTIEGFRVRVPGGVSTVPIAADLPERPEAYPHAGNFGRLPAHGLFIRHATGITLRSTAFETARPDARPPVAEFDTRGLTIE